MTMFKTKLAIKFYNDNELTQEVAQGWMDEMNTNIFITRHSGNYSYTQSWYTYDRVTGVRLSMMGYATRQEAYSDTVKIIKQTEERFGKTLDEIRKEYLTKQHA